MMSGGNVLSEMHKTSRLGIQPHPRRTVKPREAIAPRSWRLKVLVSQCGPDLPVQFYASQTVSEWADVDLESRVMQPDY